MKIRVLAFCLLALTTSAAEVVTPPVAKKVPKTIAIHGDERVDDYGWLRDKASAETLAYLEAENAYADSLMKPGEKLQKQLYDEMLGRIKQTDMNVPYRDDGYFYYSRTVEGKQYPIHARKKGTLEAEEQILLDVNQLAEGKKFMSVGATAVSDDTNLLAFTTDDVGYRQYKLHVKDLRTGKVTENLAERVGAVEWSKDNKTLIYTIENDAKRQNRVFRHALGGEAQLIFEEKDELYDVWNERSLDGDWMFIVSDSKTTNEVRFLDASKPEGEPVVMVPRKTDHKYYPEHRGDRFYIMTNDAGINYRVVTASVNDFAQANWKELVPYRKPVRIESIVLFKNHMVVRLREGGLSQLEIYDLRENGAKPHRVSFPEAAYAVFGSANAEFDTNVYRYTYQSFITPSSVYDYDLDTRKQTLLKRTEVLGGYDPAKYKVERFFVTASDGAKVPVSMVYRKDIDPKAKNPLLLYAYGSYGSSQSPTFGSGRFSLIDRGVIYALANIRGGGEMGKEWHEQGRMMTKMNTFTDFIAVGDHLVKEGYTSKEKLAIMGGSAGGLLMGAVANMRPDLFKAVVAYVPFVDVINTMSDASIPLTTQEYIEWGNPNVKEEYFYMKGYDPYGNVAKKKYPAMLVRTSLNDSQVGYWEAAKWVAKLRANKTDENVLLLKTNMGAGHGGASGRYDRLKDDAADYAWLLGALGVK
ncbi:MAG TPA: S9 family peptidase [Thermoanaerobaculia bacterium]|jgi:oligopeptidase B|nr:S9 family peptidase [Thermoanaerobaculia bacterium]